MGRVQLEAVCGLNRVSVRVDWMGLAVARTWLDLVWGRLLHGSAIYSRVEVRLLWGIVLSVLGRAIGAHPVGVVTSGVVGGRSRTVILIVIERARLELDILEMVEMNWRVICMSLAVEVAVVIELNGRMN